MITKTIATYLDGLLVRIVVIGGRAVYHPSPKPRKPRSNHCLLGKGKKFSTLARPTRNPLVRQFDHIPMQSKPVEIVVIVAENGPDPIGADRVRISILDFVSVRSPRALLRRTATSCGPPRSTCIRKANWAVRQRVSRPAEKGGTLIARGHGDPDILSCAKCARRSLSSVSRADSGRVSLLRHN